MRSRRRHKTHEIKDRCVEDGESQPISWAIKQGSTGFSRMVPDWRTGFALEPREGSTVVRADSAFRPKNAVIRLTRRSCGASFTRHSSRSLSG